jgi:hypothetical protein
LRFKGSLAIDGSAWDRESEAVFALTSALAAKPSPLELDAGRDPRAPGCRVRTVELLDGGDPGEGAAR